MTLTVRLFGLEMIHVELTDAADIEPTDAGYDHDVVSTNLDAEVDGDTACGFVTPGVGCE